MADENKETTTTAMEMKEIRALIGRIFGVLRDRQDKSDQAILELKETVESLKNQLKGTDAFEPEKPAVNPSSAAGYGNSSTLEGRGKTLTTSKVVVDIPTVDPVTTEQEEIITMAISLDAVVEYSKPYEGCCVTGYHGKRPVNILIGLGGTTHNFIDESFADKLGCDTFPINKPRSVSAAFGNVVTSRACNNFQLLLQDALFSLDLYLLPLSSNCDMVLGGEWLKTIGGEFMMDSKGMEFSFQGKKHFLPFNKSAERSKR
ncbi:uncharacterized protein LOC107780574 [Nicotiana tabacum]|uniref:Uncharacterized protein LOC107780574 n=1 Tax=Nicotiana tabacum TaxID=4097 RepID=A0A1S3YWA0_TOBAC|nr:PREDICTED: uncharacterized protein LOC107780574 [Nicotiana tabacum]